MNTQELDVESKIEKLRVGVLFKQGHLTQAAGLMNVFIYWYISRDLVPAKYLKIWLSLMVAIYFIRILVQIWFRKNIEGREFHVGLWENIFILGTFLTGSLWCVAGTWMLPKENLAQDAFLGFLLAGTTAGAAVAYCTSIMATQAFLIPSLVPFAFTMMSGGTRFQYGMAFLTLSYVALVSLLAVRLSRSILGSYRLQFENENLVKELRESQALITQSAKMAALGEMSGGVAHEINTPLAVISFETESLSNLCKNKTLEPHTVSPIIERINSMAVRIAKIVTGMRAFSADSKQQPSTATSARQILNDALDFCQSRIRTGGVILQVKKIPTDLRVVCHAYKIIQALLNIINNAFDAVQNNPDGAIDIDVVETDEYVQFVISDNGRGIPVAIRDKIMQPFFTTKEIGQGMGLGLSVALGIVKEHDGKLEYETSEDGTKFTLSLPLTKTIHAVSV